MAEEKILTRYNIIQVRMTGLKPFYAKGIKIKDEMKAEREYHSGSHDALSITLKEREVEFEIQEPKDHAELNQISYRCRNGESFTIVCLGRDENGNMVALERLDGCVIPSRERTFGDHDAVKLGIKGWALNTTPLESSYE